MTAPAVPRWYVLIEETKNTWSGREWLVSGAIPVADRVAGRELARKIAAEHQPEKPSMVRGRSVFAGIGETWLVLVKGATTTYHFRVSLMEWLGDLPA